MLVILEGCDGAGKTTFIRRLSGLTRRSHVARARGPLRDHPLVEYGTFDGYRPGVEPLVTYDRFHWGEQVYGPLLRSGSRLTDPMLRWVDARARALGAVQVYVTAPPDVIKTRLVERGDDLIEPTHVDSILDRYQAIARRWADFVVDTSSGSASLDAAGEEIIDLASEREWRAARWRDVAYLGEPVPRILLVGDETSPRHLRGERPDYRAPFVPYEDSSGHYLFDALPPEFVRACGVVNAAEVDLRDVYARAHKPRVIALGRNAERACLTARIPHAHVPHPQWHRRFRFHEQRTYTSALREAAA